jgi:Amt family ammonium transporter
MNRNMMLVALLLMAMLAPLSLGARADEAPKPDPGGATTGTAANAFNAGGPAFTADDLQKLADSADRPATNGDLLKALDTIGQSQIAINFVWTLITGFLVFFMQLGFAMLETGFCRAKNALHVFMTNLVIYPIGALGFWAAGFALMFGSLAASKIGGPASLGGVGVLNGHEFSILGFGLFGTKGFFLGPNVYDVGVYVLFLFQIVFMDTAATIPTGAMAERWRFFAFMIYGLFVSMIVYPIYGHLVWGGGGLAMLGLLANFGHGAVDFAGSGVVHAVGGMIALAGALVLGPRIGKYGKDGRPVAIPGHHIPMALVGTLILAFGWFGFNPGSTLGAAGAGNLRIGVVAVNTMLASCGGAMSALFYMKLKFGKYDPSMVANGLLAGLVAITAPCAFVTAWSSVVIGLVSGVLVCVSVFFWERRGVDDPVGAVSVHGVNGIWGVISLGLFADGTYGAGWNGVGATEYLHKAGQGVTGLLYGDSSQLIAQLISVGVIVVWAFGSAFVFFKVQSMIMRIRSTREEELEGLDISEMGVAAYPDFQVHGATSTSGLRM